MAKLEIHAFSDRFLDDAGRLLSERHARQRRRERLLPEAFDEPDAARAEVGALLARDVADGMAATRDGRVVGFLLGIRKPDDGWGPNVWVEPAGHAADQAEDVRDLYSAAAARWVEAGRKAHYAIVPATDRDLVDAWFRLGFGQQHAYGIQELRHVEWPLGVREAEEGDVDALIAIAPELSAHSRLAPVFGAKLADDDPEALRKEILEEIASEDVANLVAEHDGRIVGNFFVCPLDRSTTTHYGLARPERTAYIGFAVTYPDIRGSGAGLVLTQAAFAWARAHGYESIAADWRVTSLLASRFWPARGFRTTFLRLHRLIA